MQTYSSLSTAPAETSIALGCFDGLHVGHLAVLQEALRGTQSGLTPAVFTFGARDDAMTAVKSAPELMSSRLREELFAKLGFSQLWRVDFHAVRNISPEDFVRKVLCTTLRAKKICCGYNYRFGCGGKGDAALLQKLGGECGAEVVVLPPVLLGEEPVSSSRIRVAVMDGEMEETSRLLGRPFTIDFPVVHGRQLGRVLGTPTINQPFPSGFVLPRFGVYASYAEVDGKRFHAVTNVGVKPTVGAEAPLAETYIAGFSGNLYGRRVPVCLMKFLRPEQKFESLEALKSQILSDAASSAEILQAYESSAGEQK